MAEPKSGRVAFERAMIEEKWGELKRKIGDEDAIPFLVLAMSYEDVKVAGQDIAQWAPFLKKTAIAALERVIEVLKSS